jgi:hypothetical protein
VISSSQRPLPDNTRHSQQISMPRWDSNPRSQHSNTSTSRLVRSVRSLPTVADASRHVAIGDWFRFMHRKGNHPTGLKEYGSFVLLQDIDRFSFQKPAYHPVLSHTQYFPCNGWSISCLFYIIP